MTSEEKRFIQDLRAKGTGYKRISAIVGIPESTVKSFLKRYPDAKASSESRVTKAAKGSEKPRRKPHAESQQEAEPCVEGGPATVTEAATVSQPVTEAESATEAAPAMNAEATEALPIIEEAVTPVKKKETPVEEAKSLADEHTPLILQPIPTLPQESDSVRPCLFCGTPVQQLPGRKEKKFCSASCRTLWWNRNKYKIPRKTVHTYRCPTCGKEFYAYGTTKRKYCSQACYFKGRFYSTGTDSDA